MSNTTIHNVKEVLVTTRSLGELGQSTTVEATTLCPHCRKAIKEEVLFFSDDKLITDINGEEVMEDGGK